MQSIDAHEKGYQSRLLATIERTCYSFNWITFLQRRIALTYKCHRWLSEDVVDSCILQLRKTRPVLVTCWLRWALNSIPTSFRLHDGQHTTCPFCNADDDDITHLLQCGVAYECAFKVLCSRSSTAEHSAFRSRQASSLFRNFQAGRWVGLAGESILFCKNEILPLSYNAFVSSRLALDEPRITEFQLRLALLYLLQYTFISLRSRCCAGEVVSSHDICASMHAAYSTLV